MKLEQSFDIEAPLETVWTTLLDLEQVAPCLPGATITGHDEDGTYHGTFKVKLGPTTANYNGTIRIESSDPETHTATLAARGTDKRGQGGASATIVNTLHAAGRRHARRGRDGLHDHGPARVVRPRRHRQGHLQPAAARVRGLLAAAPGRATGGRRADRRRGGRQRRGRGLVAEGKSPAEVSGGDGAPVGEGETRGRGERRDRARRGGQDAPAEVSGRARRRPPPPPPREAEPIQGGQLVLGGPARPAGRALGAHRRALAATRPPAPGPRR